MILKDYLQKSGLQVILATRQGQDSLEQALCAALSGLSSLLQLTQGFVPLRGARPGLSCAALSALPSGLRRTPSETCCGLASFSVARDADLSISLYE